MLKTFTDTRPIDHFIDYCAIYENETSAVKQLKFCLVFMDYAITYEKNLFLISS